VISGFRRDADEICALVRYCAPWNGSRFTDVSGQRVDPICKGQEVQEVLFFLAFLLLEDGIDTLSRNVGKGLPFDAA
jgi:hypothetical protein